MLKVFFQARLSPPDRNRVFAALAKRYKREFASPDAAREFLDLIFVPASRRWTFLRNSKAGNTSAIHQLFEIEFGAALNVHLRTPGDINTDTAAHRLGQADVFRPLSAIHDPEVVLARSLRITTVRHPTTRAISSFLYICQSDRESHPRFVNDRLRMSALVGFDWDQHPGRKEGFLRFLRYIELTIAEGGMDMVDGHWRPQVFNVVPSVFRPEIIGRLEHFDRFREELHDRLGADAAALAQKMPVANRGNQESHEPLLDRDTIGAIEQVYGDDFEWLGYDPSQIAKNGAA